MVHRDIPLEHCIDQSALESNGLACWLYSFRLQQPFPPLQALQVNLDVAQFQI